MSCFLDTPSLYVSTAQPGPSGFFCQCSTPTPPSFSNLLPSFRPLRISSFCSFSISTCFLLIFYTFCFLFSPDSFRGLQWNTGGFRARSTEILHFISSYLVDHICIQESNLNSYPFFWIPRFSALRSVCTYSRSDILSPDDPHASEGVIIFMRQNLFFSKFSTSPLSSLHLYLFM